MRRDGKGLARTTPHAVAVRRLRAQPAAEIELEWFFNMAQADMGLRSNFELCLGVKAAAVHGSPEDFLEAARTHTLIRGWLRAMPDSEAGVLQAAYETRLWPRRLWDELGTLTGVVVRLACALDPWPEDRRSQEVVEMVRAGWLAAEHEKHGAEGTWATLRREGEVRFVRAMRAYGLVRGVRPCVVRWS
jgi:hypothetical protein